MTQSTTFAAGTVVTSNWLNEIDANIYDYQYNVKNYGAVGDGTTDDTAAFVAAIAAGGGSTILIPEGVYYITSTLFISNKSNTKLVGLGRPRLKFLDSAAIGISIDTNSQRCTLENIMFWGSNTTTPTITLIKCSGASAYMNINNCEYAYANIGVYLTNTYICKLYGSSYSNCDTYVKIDSSITDILLQGETYGTANIGTDPCLDIDGTMTRVIGCYFETESHTKKSILIGTSTTYVIADCQFSMSGAIEAQVTTTGIIKGNTFNNTYDTTANYAVRISGGATCSISGNTAFNDSLMTNIFFLSSSGNMVITGNFIQKYEVGIAFAYGTCAGNFVADCTNGIRCSSGSTQVVGINYLSGNSVDINQNGGGPNIIALNYTNSNSDATDNGTFFGNNPQDHAIRNTLRGTTAARPVPTANMMGQLYFDTTLDADGKPIWWTGTAWVDGVGAVV